MYHVPFTMYHVQFIFAWIIKLKQVIIKTRRRRGAEFFLNTEGTKETEFAPCGA